MLTRYVDLVVWDATGGEDAGGSAVGAQTVGFDLSFVNTTQKVAKIIALSAALSLFSSAAQANTITCWTSLSGQSTVCHTNPAPVVITYPSNSANAAMVGEGLGEGLASLFKRHPKPQPTVNVQPLDLGADYPSRTCLADEDSDNGRACRPSK